MPLYKILTEIVIEEKDVGYALERYRSNQLLNHSIDVVKKKDIISSKCSNCKKVYIGFKKKCKKCNKGIYLQYKFKPKKNQHIYTAFYLNKQYV